MMDYNKEGWGEKDKRGSDKEVCVQNSKAYQDDMEHILRQAAEKLPKPCREVPVSESMKMRAEKRSIQSRKETVSEGMKIQAERPSKQNREEPVSVHMKTKNETISRVGIWRSFGRAAAAVFIFIVLGGGTAVAASPAVREAVVRFFTSGTKEIVPNEQFSEPEKQDRAPVSIGDVTWIQDQKLDEHFTASYLSSSNYLDLVETSSGHLLFYTEDAEKGDRTYYQIVDGTLQTSSPKTHVVEGRVSLGTLYGIMSYGGEIYGAVTLPEMTFTVDWQQYGETDLLLLNTNSRQFDVAGTFGGTQDGEPLTGSGSFCAYALKGDTEWVEVRFLYDVQSTEYSYPFLMNIRTKEVRNPLADVDLSQYPCITDLSISDDKKTATAKAGADHNSLKNISIDLESGEITTDSLEEEKLIKEALQKHEERQEQEALPKQKALQEQEVNKEQEVKEEQELLPEQEDSAVRNTLSEEGFECETAFATSDHTVFYTTGTQEQMNGYLYNAQNGRTSTLFTDVAWGYMWEYGFADRYVSLIGGNYAAMYKEPENEVYLLDLTDGRMQLLEGIPASHDVSFLWNSEQSILSISVNTESGASRLAFFMPRTDHAWYFERSLSDDVHEMMSCWYGEYGYLIQAVSEDRDQYYLYLYEYTP